MKNIAPFLLLFVLCSCTKTTDKTILNLIAQNNRYYVIQLEEYRLEMKYNKMDDPLHFDDTFCQAIDKSFDGIKKLKSQSDYDTILKKVKGLGYVNKIGETIKSIQSDEPEVLKNNLYVNLSNVIHAKKVSTAMAISTHCKFGDQFKVVKKTEKDSVSLTIYTYNSFQVNVDQITDGKDELSDYTSNREYKVWTIKYKPKSKNTYCTGKIFFGDADYGKVLLVQEFDDRKAMSKNPFQRNKKSLP